MEDDFDLFGINPIDIGDESLFENLELGTEDDLEDIENTVSEDNTDNNIEEENNKNRDEELNLFGETIDDVVLPTDDAEISAEDIEKQLKGAEDLISNGVIEAISGETVKDVLIPTEENLIQPNYVLDISDVKEVDTIQIIGLNSLIDNDGDVAIYLYSKGEMQRAGMGRAEKLNRIILTAVSNVMGDKCKIYKNYKIGEEAEIVSSKNIASLRLHI